MLDPPSPATGTAPPPEDEYALVDLGGGPGLLSILFFVLALGSRFLVELIPVEMRPFPWNILLPGLGVPVLAGIGLLLGLVGLRRASGRGFARVGVLLNSIAVLLSVLAILAFYLILPG
ncbi:MAG: hypothetical protein R3234_03680 [Thermoanaerobaculia bacterium]|nr:hypothetical protein [Thermoanaerobaculia bacterium]